MKFHEKPGVVAGEFRGAWLGLGPTLQSGNPDCRIAVNASTLVGVKNYLIRRCLNAFGVKLCL